MATIASAGGPLRSPSRRMLGDLLRRYTFAFALFLTVGLLITNVLLQTNFSLTENLAAMAPLALAAIASTPSIISGRGGIDISVAPLLNLCTVIYVLWLAPHGLGGAASVPLVLAFGAAVGAINGTLVAVFRFRPIVATLCMYFVLNGVNIGLLGASQQVTGSSWVPHLAQMWGGFFPGPLVLYALPLLIWFVLGRTGFRGMLYAVGGNDAAAYSSGVNVIAVRIAAYALGGLFAAIGGFALLALVNSADAAVADAYTLSAIAAVALGGTPFIGGVGGLFGAITGAAALYLLQTALETLQVDTTYLPIVYGGILLVGVVLGGHLAIDRQTAT